MADATTCRAGREICFPGFYGLDTFADQRDCLNLTIIIWFKHKMQKYFSVVGFAHVVHCTL